MEYLIEQQCDVNKTDINNVSALHIACQRGYLDAVKLLMKGKRLSITAIHCYYVSTATFDLVDF